MKTLQNTNYNILRTTSGDDQARGTITRFLGNGFTVVWFRRNQKKRLRVMAGLTP